MSGYQIEITEAAEEDLREAFLWYEQQKAHLGEKFESAILKAFDSIEENPLKVRVRYGVTRIHFLRKFPYGIHFKVEAQQILIVAVFHTAQSPKRWDR